MAHDLKRLLKSSGLKHKIWLEDISLEVPSIRQFLLRLEDCKVKVCSYPALKFESGSLEPDQKPPISVYLEIRSLSKSNLDEIADFLGTEIFVHDLGELDDFQYVTYYGCREGKALHFLCEQTEPYWPLDRWARNTKLHGLTDAWFKVKDASQLSVKWWAHAHADVRQIVQTKLKSLVECESALAGVLEQSQTKQEKSSTLLPFETRFKDDPNLRPYLNVYNNLEILRKGWERQTTLDQVLLNLAQLKNEELSWLAAKLEEKCQFVPYKKPASMARNKSFDKNYRLVYKRREFEPVCELSHMLALPLRFYPSLTLPTSKHGLVIGDTEALFVDKLVTKMKPWFITHKRTETFVQAQRFNLYFQGSESSGLLTSYVRQLQRNA